MTGKAGFQQTCTLEHVLGVELNNPKATSSPSGQTGLRTFTVKELLTSWATAGESGPALGTV